MILDKVLSYKLKPVEQTISEKDCMLYSLGIGLGMDPLDQKQLQFVHEANLKVFPSQSVVIAHPGAWVKDAALGISWLRLLHGEQTITQHKPLIPGKTYIGNYRILGVLDKGADKGCILYQEKTLTDKENGELFSTVTSSYFLRDDGGCGSSNFEPPPQVEIPDRPVDKSVEIKTATNSALIYRLSGDFNPLHSDPEKAKKAGFDRPILHGLCTFGVATRAVLDAYCDSNPAKLDFLGLRFSSPVYPGETIKIDLWNDGADIKFVATAVEREAKVINQGLARLKG